MGDWKREVFGQEEGKKNSQEEDPRTFEETSQGKDPSTFKGRSHQAGEVASSGKVEGREVEDEKEKRKRKSVYDEEEGG